MCVVYNKNSTHSTAKLTASDRQHCYAAVAVVETLHFRTFERYGERGILAENITSISWHSQTVNNRKFKTITKH